MKDYIVVMFDNNSRQYRRHVMYNMLNKNAVYQEYLKWKESDYCELVNIIEI